MNDSARPTVVVSETLDEKALDYLAEHATVILATPENILDIIGPADGLCVRTYTQVDQALLDTAPRLKVVGRAGVALENIDVLACRARGVEVVHTPEANTLAVVDYTMAVILRMNRRFWPMTGFMTDEQFHGVRKGTFGRFLADATLGIIGAGRIGSRVAAAAAGLGMTVLYNDILDITLDCNATPVDKATLFAESDIITIHVPLTDLTNKMINADSLAKFKDGAQFINAARGPCVDYDALGAALRSKKLSAVTVDCHDPEPPPEDYALFGLNNAYLTPHTAARVPQAMANMSKVVEDIVAMLQGREPRFAAQEGAF
ncbi:NAD(P)-dependent oxidoreductase [Planctomycetota bacterium]